MVELLVVISVMVVLGSLTTTAIRGIGSAQDLTRTAYDVADYLSHARAHAVTQKTYVAVGIHFSGSGQDQALTMLSVYSRNASLSDFADLDAGELTIDAAINGEALAPQLARVRQFSRVQSPDGMGEDDRNAGNFRVTSIPGDLRLERRVAGQSTPVRFDRVVVFQPSGAALIIEEISSSGFFSVPRVVDIPLALVEGGSTVTPDNYAVVRLYGSTGRVEVLRPGDHRL